MSTIRLPSTLFTVPLVIVSFGAIVGGAVYCDLSHPPWRASVVDQTGDLWISQNRLRGQVKIETIVFGLARL
jgi:hypothetical protein